MAREAVALAGVNAFYGDSHALYDVSFSLQEGRVLALLGRNGAGKTTCIHSIVGFLPVRSGEIRLFGERISSLAPEAIARRGVGLVPQGRRVFPSLTVRENLVVAARPASKGWDLAAVLSAFPGLAGRQNQTAGSLSGGEQQMLAIGRALMTNPRVLLLDEPSEGLAPAIVHEVGRVLGKLRASGLSILLVEQNTKLALGLADEVVTLNSGRVAYEGPCEKIRHDESFLTQQLGVY
ncbi:MAG: ABC transporter ATP-binding protein [Deltaproteobacteria bacterium]|nr:MAG: ABC transporter ATP-binding protein [Deltaproteobacteria bacterium]